MKSVPVVAWVLVILSIIISISVLVKRTLALPTFSCQTTFNCPACIPSRHPYLEWPEHSIFVASELKPYCSDFDNDGIYHCAGIWIKKYDIVKETFFGPITLGSYEIRNCNRGSVFSSQVCINSNSGTTP